MNQTLSNFPLMVSSANKEINSVTISIGQGMVIIKPLGLPMVNEFFFNPSKSRQKTRLLNDFIIIPFILLN